MNHKLEAAIQKNTFGSNIRIQSTSAGSTNQLCLDIISNRGSTYTLDNGTLILVTYRANSINGAASAVS